MAIERRSGDVGGETARGQQTRRGGRRLSSAVGLAVGLCLGAVPMSGCGDDGAGMPDGLSARLYGPSGAENPFLDVGWMRLYVRGDGMDAPLGRFVRYEPGGAADLEGIPFGEPGERRQLVVEGWVDNNGEPAYVISTGRSKWFEVQPSVEEPLALDVLFTRVNSLVELPASATGIAQRLQSGRMGAAVTTSDREIIVSGGGTVDSAGAQWWEGGTMTRVIASVEAVDLATNAVQPRADLLTPRVWHTATGLQFGQAIVAGGFDASGRRLDDVELYNPPGVANGSPARLPKLAVGRAGHTATLVNATDRLMLFVGGDEAGTWELWDPVQGSRGAVALPDNKSRRHHRATPFHIVGRTEPGVLISGGESGTEVHQTVMLFDSATQQVIPFNEAMPGGARAQHGAVFVPEQNIIYLIGGFTSNDRQGVTDRIDAFDTGVVRFRPDAAGLVLGTARGGLDAALLADNRILIAGGMGREPAGAELRPLKSLELIYDFVDVQTQLRQIRISSSYNPGGGALIPSMGAERVGHAVVALPSGQGVIIGGAAINPVGGGFQPRLEVITYNPQ